MRSHTKLPPWRTGLGAVLAILAGIVWFVLISQALLNLLPPHRLTLARAEISVALAVLLVVETTDLLFATDSIPAVLAITLKPFIVYTSNVFAVLGLRSMYFVLAGAMELFHYLHYGLAVVLIFIGAKMVASDYYQIPTGIALGVVAGVLLVSVLASLLHPRSQGQ